MGTPVGGPLPGVPAPRYEVRGREGVLLDVGDVLGDLVERRVAIDLVATGGEQRVLLVGAGGGDVGGPDHPDAHALVAPGVEVAGGVDGHLVVGCVQRADVDVVEAALAADEHLVQRPVPLDGRAPGLHRDLRAGRDRAVSALGGDVGAHAAAPSCLRA